ncbi:MAG: hypothetical protein EAZ57_02385 [Cytophagales bacterium]|nr:MAG: hypothetical protein EAZ67_02200 [Cytophagales bacterium]TAF61965.1 MAG: hypothetical protein EAZ57_02385 [Cytophagales bacterium]
MQQEIKQIIEKLYNEHITEQELFLVDVDVLWAQKKRITVVIDSDTPLTISHCAEVSRKLNAVLDEAIASEEAYDFEVTSPGADSPLRLFRQFHKHLGRQFKVLLRDANTLTGKLEAIEDNNLVFLAEEEPLADPSKKKTKPKMRLVPRTVPFESVQEASIILSFK